MIVRIAALALLITLSAALTRECGGRGAYLVTVTGALMLLGILFSRISPLLSALSELAERSAAAPYIGTVLRVLGVGYVTAIGADLCRDLGDGATADRLEACGKIEILLLAVPSFVSLTELALSLV